MTATPILAAGFFMSLVVVLFVLTATVLILVVLIQKGKGGGLSGALAGGAMSNILGSQAKGPLTWITIGLVAVFLILAVLLAKFYKPSGPRAIPAAVPAQSVPVQPPPAKPAPSQPLETPAAVPQAADSNTAK